MRAIAQMPHEVAAGIQVVLADIDDTITTEGRLTAEAYTALENLHNAGIRVAPVTGRPADFYDREQTSGEAMVQPNTSED